MSDIYADVTPVCSFSQNNCLGTDLGTGIETDIEPVCSFAKSGCLEIHISQVISEIQPTFSFAKSSCLQIAIINALHAYTQPITAIIEKDVAT